MGESFGEITPAALKTLRVGSLYIKSLTGSGPCLEGSELAYLKSSEWGKKEEIEEQLEKRRGEKIAPPYRKRTLNIKFRGECVALWSYS
ncbi:hypothetical protein AVEN_184868-1 [Araneus ventricosus]|uniref:Uncharacterized protein n=1 Tax=Araneus ventricosus TaxID=182803 RepID=A0A4Y2WVC5_ARAVE|nr:hypothetical protein AVEN_184868-1 [Araneus ventricosus]